MHAWSHTSASRQASTSRWNQSGITEEILQQVNPQAVAHPRTGTPPPAPCRAGTRRWIPCVGLCSDGSSLHCGPRTHSDLQTTATTAQPRQNLQKVKHKLCILPFSNTQSHANDLSVKARQLITSAVKNTDTAHKYSALLALLFSSLKACRLSLNLPSPWRWMCVTLGSGRCQCSGINAWHDRGGNSGTLLTPSGSLTKQPLCHGFCDLVTNCWSLRTHVATETRGNWIILSHLLFWLIPKLS